jgi:hypothetical protein
VGPAHTRALPTTTNCYCRRRTEEAVGEDDCWFGAPAPPANSRAEPLLDLVVVQPEVEAWSSFTAVFRAAG